MTRLEFAINAFCEAWVNYIVPATPAPAPIPPPEPVFAPPYDTTNAKITNVDGSEVPSPAAFKNSKYFQILENGSFKYTLPEAIIGTTPNARFSRQEWRFYKNLTAKTNWQWDEPLSLSYGFRIDKLPPANEQIYVSQIHGIGTAAIMKLSVGKGKIRALIAYDEAGKNTEALDFLVEPVEGQSYRMEWKRVANIFTAALIDSSGKIYHVQTNKITRKDEQYPKAGIYGAGPAVVTHFKI